MKAVINRSKLQSLLFSMLIVLILSMSACSPKPSTSNISESPVVKPYWIAHTVSFYSDTEAQVIWQNLTPETLEYLVERIDLTTGEPTAAFPISMEQNPMSYVRFNAGLIHQRDVLKQELTAYSRDGEFLGRWHVEGKSSALASLSDDFSKISDIVKGDKLLIYSSADEVLLWDSDWLGEQGIFKDLAFLNAHFLGNDQVLFLGGNPQHEYFTGIIDLEHSEAMPAITEGKSTILPAGQGYMLTWGKYGGAPNVLLKHRADCIMVEEGADGKFQMALHPVPATLKSSYHVFGGHLSPYRVYVKLDEDYNPTLIVTDPQGLAVWETFLNADDSGGIATDYDSHISPDGKTILLNDYHADVWVITKEKAWTLPHPGDR